MVSELADFARRLEQQLTAFEKLHMDELARIQEQLDAYLKVQNDELEMLRTELRQLQDRIAAMNDPEPAASATPPLARPEAEAPTLTRRDLITGNVRSLYQRRG